MLFAFKQCFKHFSWHLCQVMKQGRLVTGHVLHSVSDTKAQATYGYEIIVCTINDSILLATTMMQALERPPCPQILPGH